MSIERHSPFGRALVPGIAQAGMAALLGAVAARFRRHERRAYALARACTPGAVVWSKALAREVADVWPDVSPNKDRGGACWAGRYVWRINTHRAEVVSVYVPGYELAEFFEHVLPRLDRRVALLVGDSDLPVTSGAPDPRHLQGGFPHDGRIVAMFVQNLDLVHPRAFPLPIGVDFHTVYRSNVTIWGEKPGREPRDQEADLLAAARDALPLAARKRAVYVQFNVVSNVFERARCWKAMSRLRAVHLESGKLPRSELWCTMSGFAFVASPPGNGLDCHRTWEALVLGCVPIVQRIPAMAPLFDGLPVWQVDDYGEVTDAAIEEKLHEVGSRQAAGAYDMEKLTVPWWRRHVRETIGALAACTGE